MPRSNPKQRASGAPAAQPDLLREAFARSVIRGLSDNPRWLSCRYLYDHQGSQIFERITEQPEYYPTRSEASILQHQAARIRDLCGGTPLVELGAGSATKTRHLLRAWASEPHLNTPSARYVPIEISRSMLEETCAALRNEFPSLVVQPLAGSYEQALPALRQLSPLTLLFLGSSVGNFNPEELAEFFDLLTANLTGGDHLLLGVDLVKDRASLEAAYNDAAGWSAEFTLNLFARMNRELGTTIDMNALEHEARWNQELSRIDIYARALRPVTIALPEWNREFRLDAGETVLVEISRKFHSDEMVAVAAGHGFDHVETFTDPGHRFGLILLRYGRQPDAVAALRARLGRELSEQRERTLEITAPLSARQQLRQHSPILSPVAWDLGHIADYEREWIDCARQPEAQRTAGAQADAGRRDAGLYDPIRFPRAVRGSLALADPTTCTHTLTEARTSTTALLAETSFSEETPLLREGYVFSMIAQHEAQHSETILQGIQRLPNLAYEPSRRVAPRDGRTLDEEVFVPAGPFLMGTDDRATAYDNERPAHVIDLNSYWIDVAPVTNAAFLAFMEDGGYRRRALWTTDGWRWLLDAKACHPGQWQAAADGNWNEYAFGRLTPLDGARPVVHVCWHEASACAQWLGKRLPTEAEWEKAAAWDLERGLARVYPWGDSAPTAERANLDQRTFAPSAVGAYPRGSSYFGCEQMHGDVWEWTASDFLPYPGFDAFPYPEYSQLHFGARHKVLRGGSWATPAIVMRNTFRNWDLPQRRQIFAGFRCARD